MEIVAISTRATATLVASATIAVLATSAAAAPTGADLQIEIAVSNELTGGMPSVPNGGTATVTRLDFAAGYFVGLINFESGSARIRYELAEGLRWGADAPDPTEFCTGTASTAECDVPLREPTLTQSGWGIGWNVIAERTGSYVLHAEIIETSTPDPDLSNNSASVTVVVTESTGGGSGGGSGSGGGASVLASAAKVSPAKPKAGSLITATVRVSVGGAPVRPTRVACAGAIGSAKLRGAPRAGSGTATCAYRTPRSAKGKTLRGAVSFTARGQRFTKRFAAKLR